MHGENNEGECGGSESPRWETVVCVAFRQQAVANLTFPRSYMNPD